MKHIEEIKNKLIRLNRYEILIPKSIRKGMLVDGKLFVNNKLLKILEPQAIYQLTNVAMLPGVIEPVIGMPDIHWGYGQPVGTVSAFDENEGIISAGMVGFDINCGINLIRTNINYKEFKKNEKKILDLVFKKVPVGVGRKSNFKLNNKEIEEVLIEGAQWATKKGFGVKNDWKNMEENGKMNGVEIGKISKLALKRGKIQLGTLGAGNHFIEIQKISDIYDKKVAKKNKLEKNNVVIMIHTGSRGLGHQIATDYLKIQQDFINKNKINIPDKQLVYSPINTDEAQDYLSAMKAAVNYSFANKLIITQWIRDSFSEVLKTDWEKLGMETVYGIAHNICKLEKHKINKKMKKVYVHRKGTTRSFPNKLTIIAGSMGTSSYVLNGTKKAMESSFGSTCHGSGRVMSRTKAIEKFSKLDIENELKKKGILAKAGSIKGLVEEYPSVYKNVNDVVDVVDKIGISKKIIKMKPLSVIKG